MIAGAATRRPLIAGNWKMHKTVAETRALARALVALAIPPEIDVAVAPPFTALAAAAEALAGSRIALAAQSMHDVAYGAFTGEISAAMLRELGVAYAILGHSERRAFCGETDDAVNRKVRSALASGITPIVAVGESEAEHGRGETQVRVTAQTRAAFVGVPPEDVARCVVAYEPIWAIGTGLNDDPTNANAVIGQIRASVAGLAGARILYGGSMKGDNAVALMAQPEIDGGLIGGASLSAASFDAVIDAARTRVAVR
ncbi:MAG: triose-phosphate isomerase [Vulcanimicrobiaceae bacterium]